jgi:hypothetical protein
MCRRTVPRAFLALVAGLLTGPALLTSQEPATVEELRAELEVLRNRIAARRAEARSEREAARAQEAARSRDVSPALVGPLLMELPDVLSEWLGGRGQINRVVPPADLLLRLVLEPSAAHRRCTVGEVDACRAALGLDTEEKGGGASVRQWYDPGVARGVVWERANGTSEWDRSDVQACLRQSGEPCLQVLDRWGFTRAAPVTMAARASLVRFALAEGAEGARERMAALGPDATLHELLSAAARRPVKVLAAEWSASLRDAHPRHGGSQERRDRGTALAWASLFAFLAMTNTRWRIGR